MKRYIDTEKLIDYKFAYITNERYKDGKRKSEDEIYAYKVGYNEAIDNIIRFASTADVRENVHAHWIIEREQMSNGEIAVGQFCSNCDYPQYLTTKFCPNCGAVMDERSEEE